MAAFEYEAVDAQGRSTKGVISADSERLARRELRRQQLLPVSLRATLAKTSAPSNATTRPFRLTAPIRPKDLTLMTRQLATLVGAAAPIEEALKTIALNAEKPAVRSSLLATREAVVEGQRLSHALVAGGAVFTPYYRSMVAAGEASGSLGAVLDRLADALERQQKLSQKVTTAMVYPAFLAVTAISVVVALLSFVVPKVVEQFDSIGQELPAITQFMIALSEATRAYGLVAAVVTVVGIFAFIRALRLPPVRLSVDRFLLSVPIVGRLALALEGARLGRTLSTLISSGAPVLDALVAARNTIGNRMIHAAVGQAASQVREGTPLSKALRATKRFPPMVVYMTAMGEASGTLDMTLSKAADFLESEFESFTDAALTLLEPVIIIAMGAVVATIVLAILMPILQLNTLALG